MTVQTAKMLLAAAAAAWGGGRKEGQERDRWSEEGLCAAEVFCDTLDFHAHFGAGLC